MFEALNRSDDPGLPSLRADRLVLAMRDAQIARLPRSGPRYVEAAIGWFVIGLLVWLALIAL